MAIGIVDALTLHASLAVAPGRIKQPFFIAAASLIPLLFLALATQWKAFELERLGDRALRWTVTFGVFFLLTGEAAALYHLATGDSDPSLSVSRSRPCSLRVSWQL